MARRSRLSSGARASRWRSARAPARWKNLARVEDDPNALGTAFLGSVWDALQGAPAARERRHQNLRALFPMYETSFQLVALQARRITGFAQLDGRRVGAGPAESFLRAAA
jgi:TRAP-type uncharacterized transport system substrate-binding protein